MQYLNKPLLPLSKWRLTWLNEKLKMNIGILGNSPLAKALAERLSNAGNQVVFGIQQAEEDTRSSFQSFRCPQRYTGYHEAIDQSEVVLICEENGAFKLVLDALKEVPTKDKLLIDCTNSNYDQKQVKSNVQILKKSVPDAKVFKAFNNLGMDYPISDPVGLIRETYYCGDDFSQRAKVKKLIEQMGFKAIFAGEIGNAPLLEAFYHLRKEISWNLTEQANLHFRLVSI